MAAVSASIATSVQIGNPAQKLAQAIPQASVSVSVAQKKSLAIRAQADDKQSRRSTLALIASAAAASVAQNAFALNLVKLEGPPPPIGGLPGTDSSDEARDTDAPLTQRFYLQPKTPEEALARAKEAIATLPEIKGYVDRKAWPYVRNELRSEFSYLRFDLATVIASKAKPEKKALEAELKSVNEALETLDFAARQKNLDKALAAFSDVESKLASIISKLG